MTRTALLSSLAALLAPLALGALAACGGEEPAPLPPPPPPPPPATVEAPAPTASAAPAPTTPPTPAEPPAPAKPPAALTLGKDAGFSTPESALYDAKNDVYIVTNINGGPSAADGNGYISRVSPDGTKVEAKWIEGGKKGVKLDAPKGTAIVNGTLYVADITRLRMFDANKGTPRGEVALPGCTFANDVTAGPGGTIFVSDTGVTIDDKGVTPTHSDAVYVVDKGKAKVLAKGDDLGHPNGLLFANDKLWVVSFGSGEIFSLDKAGKKGDAQKLPKGQLDGIVAAGDAVYVSSWEGQGVYKGKPGGDWTLVIPGIKAPADIGFDSKRSRLLVPLFQDSGVEAYAAP